MNQHLIDAAVFAELQDSAGAEFVAELVQTFIDEAPAMLAELRAARVAGDGDRFRRAAHSLKSNSQTFGATALGEAARRLELDGLHADAAQDRQAIDALQAGFERVATALLELSRG